MATLIQETVSEKSSLSSRAEEVGRELARYGLVVVVGWIGLMKFTTYEAEGIRPFVANSPLMSWVYGLISVPGFSATLGVVEVTIALLIAARPFSPRQRPGGRDVPHDPELPRHHWSAPQKVVQV